MKNVLLLFVCVLSFVVNAQLDRPQRGPYNTLPGGVIDGVAIQDEVPVRTKLEYEYVRASDVTWQKRVYSRIDAREKMNHDIFLPYDSFDGTLSTGSAYRPANASEIDDPTWNKSQTRWSLWTIIMRHVFLGDLTVYRVASEYYPDAEDGYSLKYPIERQGQNDYFENKKYRSDINGLFASGGLGPKLRIYRPNSEDTMDVIKTDQTLQEYLDSLRSDADYEELYGIDQERLQVWWDFASVNSPIRKDAISMWVPSNNIVAYHIKEDWYFDKERSVLDKRIIAIAPVARYTYTDPEEGESATRGELLVYDNIGKPYLFSSSSNEFEQYDGKVEEREMFWLYFDELRNVLVNYYVYNDKNDAQWMSFDDLFWKRRFTLTIYRVSDKFDREIEDYKFGVDALYEAERMRESIRDWEHDLWHF
ncbi:MAG: hypothetical protein ACKOWX_02120 [Flavobacteriales bacterium]